ncbi:MAG: MATE family efflux transporter [Pseudomonadota bacterium]|nr:MATE family efflux transporter [Pseudomonadota bacterium]
MRDGYMTPAPDTQPRLIAGPVAPHLFHLSWPMAIGLFATIGFNLVDTWFVSMLGTRELAAISFTFPVIMFFASIALGLGTGAASIISRAIGAGQPESVRRHTMDALLLALIVVGIGIVLGLATIEPLFRMMGADSSMIDLIAEYMRIWYPGMLLVVIPLTGNSVIRAAGNIRTPALIMVVASLLNIVFDPLLIFGLFGFPRLEMAGAALATVLSRTFSLVAVLYVLSRRERMLTFARPHLRDLLISWRGILHIGMPAAVMQMINPLAIAVVTALLARFGESAVAGFGAASRVEALAVLIFISLAVGMGPFVGQNWGARRLGRIDRAFALSIRACLILTVIVAAVLALAAAPTAALFSDDATVRSVTVLYLRMVPISFGFLGMMMVVNTAFNALGRPTINIINGFVRLVVLYVPLVVVMGNIWGVNGIFAAVLVNNVLAGLIALGWLGGYWPQLRRGRLAVVPA